MQRSAEELLPKQVRERSFSASGKLLVEVVSDCFPPYFCLCGFPPIFDMWVSVFFMLCRGRSFCRSKRSKVGFKVALTAAVKAVIFYSYDYDSFCRSKRSKVGFNVCCLLDLNTLGLNVTALCRL